MALDPQQQAACARAALTVVIPPAQAEGIGFVADGPDWPARLAHLATNVLRSTRHSVAIVHEPLVPGAAAPARLVEVVAELRAAYGRVRMGEGTLDEQGARCGRNLISTLQRAPRWLSVPAPPRPWLGLPAFVVSAGPSLDKNVALLSKASTRGPVLAVDASVAPLLRAGCEPTAVVTIESKSTAFLLRDLPRHVPMLLESRAHPDQWAVSDHPIAFLDGEQVLSQVAIELGTCPVPYSTTVAGAAISLALQLGASPIVLVGQDLAYTGGRCYASGTACESLAIDIEGAEVVYRGSFGFEYDLQREPLRYRDAWGQRDPDDIVPSIFGFDLMAQWIERVAVRHPVINATEGGSRIAGTREERLADVIARFPVATAPIPSVGALATQRDSGPTIERMRRACERVLQDPSITLPPSDCQELYLWCASRIYGARDVPSSERASVARRATEDAARAACAAIGDGGCP